MSKGINLQDAFLDQLLNERISVRIFLTNGVQMKGYIKGHDSYMVVIEADGKQQTIFKHALSTISPSRNVKLMVEE